MRFRGTISFVVLFTISITAFGQGFQGGLRGSVRDAAGAVVPGVEVMLTNEATNLSRMTLSNESGEYSFAALESGSYDRCEFKQYYQWNLRPDRQSGRVHANHSNHVPVFVLTVMSI